METKADILEELRSLSPLLASLQKVNVFTVPSGYFDSISITVLACLPRPTDSSLPEQQKAKDIPAGYFDQLADSILQKIKIADTAGEETRELSPLLQGLQQKNVFEAPRGYFENLAGSVLDKINTAGAIEELQVLSPLLYSLQQKNVFEAPQGYFENLAGSVLDKINAAGAMEELQALSPLLYSLQQKNVFEAPPGYFENLNGSVLDKINAAGAMKETLSPVLLGLQQTNVFEAPQGYFEGLADEVLNKVKRAPAKVVEMPRRRSILRYAVAAMVTGIMAVGIYRSVNNNPVQPNGTVKPVALASVSLDASIEKGRQMDDKQFNEALNNLSESDIANYLEKNGDVTDVATLNNNLDDASLPSQDDYLLDEGTLDKFMKEIEKTTVNN